MSETGSEVLYEVIEKHIALVTINRARYSNCVTPEVTSRLNELVKQIDEDEDIRVAILTGSGEKSFCAGADIGAIAEGRGHELVHETGGFAGFVNARPVKPWITAVNGIAFGGGLELALSTDMVVAAEHAKFGLPEVKVGVAALAGGIYRLPRAIPRATAMEMIATGAAISAQRGYELGLVNRVVQASDVIKESVTLASKIAANAPVSVRESLQLARKTFDNNEEELLRINAEVQQRIMSTEDSMEGARAFKEKRNPIWKGK